MDAFYASVEQRDFPEYRGKPIVVGAAPDRRGVVAAASYEARKYGVHSAMPSATALRKCPDLIFVKHRFGVYKEVSQQIREIFFSYTDLVEPLSLDEAYLDVTENKMHIESAVEVAKQIRAKIKEKTQLTASAGVSYNKFLAKIASDLDKPDGLSEIPYEQAEAFLESLPVKKFFGIGKVTAAKMEELGIMTGKDLKSWPEIELIKRFGKAGGYYYRIVRGEDSREVQPERERKSLGAERTFEEDLKDLPQMYEALDVIAEEVLARMERSKLLGRTLTLKVKYHDFTIANRSKTLNRFLTTKEALWDEAKKLLLETNAIDRPVRLLGLTFSKLESKDPAPDTSGQLRLL